MPIQQILDLNVKPLHPRRKLTDEQRRAIFETLLKQSENGKLVHGSISSVTTLFSVDRQTVTRIWKRAKSCMEQGSFVDVSRRLLKVVGRKKIEIDISKIMDIPLRQRTNIRSLAKAMDVPETSLHRRIKKGEIRTHSSALKPQLTTENKNERLRYCKSWIESHTLEGKPTFKDMFDVVHIDEKWFYMSKASERYYLHPMEEDPYRSYKSKRFIPKIMFLAAVARPRFDTSRNQVFSGKIGIFPFTYTDAAKKNSKNRVIGTLETKPILSVTKDVTRSCLIEKVLPAIRDKWPRSSLMNTIYIQQDNAKPHINPMDDEFNKRALTDGFDIRLSFQPPNSPDLNVLDLGFFRAIQSLQYREAPRTIDELVHVVKKSFEELSVESLNDVFLTLQACMIEVIKVNGGNNYNLPHIGKNKLRREGHLPSQLQIEVQLQNA